MSPRTSGGADKLGNQYEGAWTALHVLEVLAGRAESLTLEELGEIGKGAEFTLRRGTAIEVHQVKRQRGSANHWTLGDLRAEGVLESARRHVAAGRQFHFVSTVPAQHLQDLAELARHSPDARTFMANLAREARTRFDYLSSAAVYGSVEAAWETLRETWGRWTSERDVRNWGSALAGLLLSGASGTAAVVTLADLAVENLATRLDRQAICDQLAGYQLALIMPEESRGLAHVAREMHLRWKSSIEREMLQPSILRTEAQQIVEHLAGDARCLFAIGVGGAGKSTVLHGVVDQAEAQGWTVLAFRLDREEPFSSATELGTRFGLRASPASVLARVSQGRPSLLVIDQLDAVSKASGRMPHTFDAVADLVRETTAFPEMRVLVACRKFDLDNDDRIRTLIKDHQAQQVTVDVLSDEQVVSAVDALGVVAAKLTRQQREILRLPLHLKLLSTIADQTAGFYFATTRELFDAYWDHKRQDCRAHRGSQVRFAEVVGLLADEMSVRQRLAVPATVLDAEDLAEDADIMTSEHVLVRDGWQVAFFHETFFDYAFARHWTRRRQSLVEFLLAGDQELFRRTQVRQILTYLREEDPERFLIEMKALLEEPRVRYHIKHLALALLSALSKPTAAEWHMVEGLLSLALPVREPLWLTLRATAWFDRLADEGVLASWLAADDEQLRFRAVEVMAGGVKERPDRVAQLIAPHADSTVQYPVWLRRVVRFADVNQSRSLFELVQAAVTSGHYDDHEHELFMSVRELATERTGWAMDLLTAYLVDRPGALTVDESGKVSVLRSRDHWLIGLVTSVAAAMPEEFCRAMVPYMQRIMALTGSIRDGGRILERHFWSRDHEPPHHELEDALAAGTVSALKAFASQQPDAAMPLLEQLSADPHETAQWLLYEGLTAAGPALAEYSLSQLLDRGDGLAAVPTWTGRLLIQSISGQLATESFTRLEHAVLQFSPSWEGRPSGRSSFTLLSAMDETRLSPAARRRLGELRRLFQAEQPPEPDTMTGGWVGSPIPQVSAQRMKDDQWLRAMATHNRDRTDWGTLTGGAVELSSVLQEEVKKKPGHFARLALRLGPEVHEAYPRAILIGLSDSATPVDPELVFQAIRHIASLSHPPNERWLGWPLRHHLKVDIPDDLIGMLIDNAVNSPDPANDDITEPLVDDGGPGHDRLIHNGINSSRGQSVEMLGNILIFDTTGHRTSLVTPVLHRLASDSSLAVRSCTAHLVTACLRHARTEAIAAFHILIEADDRLLATRHAARLILYIANGDAAIAQPVIQRMLASDQRKVRQEGGRLAAYAGLELRSDELLAAVTSCADPATRSGAAEVCAGRLPRTVNAVAAGDLLRQYFYDPDQAVCEAAAGVAVALRGRALLPFNRELTELIESSTFPHAISQLLITLDEAPDRVDGLILKCAQRYTEVFGADVGDFSTRAAAEAREVGGLLLRAHAQATDPGTRSTTLDLLDSLLASGAYGVPELLNASDR